MKVMERVFEHRMRQQIEIDDLQFGFVQGEGTADAIFVIKQITINLHCVSKKQYIIIKHL